MSRHYKLSVEFVDTSYPSLIRGLEEILEKLKKDDEQIESGKELVYESSYVEDEDYGKYLVKIKTCKN